MGCEGCLAKCLGISHYKPKDHCKQHHDDDDADDDDEEDFCLPGGTKKTTGKNESEREANARQTQKNFSHYQRKCFKGGESERERESGRAGQKWLWLLPIWLGVAIDMACTLVTHLLFRLDRTTSVKRQAKRLIKSADNFYICHKFRDSRKSIFCILFVYLKFLRARTTTTTKREQSGRLIDVTIP